jgi:hypothetical protein
MVFPAKSEKNILQEMENKINSNKTDRREVTDNRKKIYVFLNLNPFWSYYKERLGQTLLDLQISNNV